MSGPAVKIHLSGLMDYMKAWEYQQKIHQELVECKLRGKDDQKACPNHLILCQHPHVYTLGRSGKVNNLLVHEEFLKNIHASFYKTNRGGDITYHGPGQIVGYPIFDLEVFRLSVKSFIFKLEEAIIKTLKHYTLQAGRLENATGVWLSTGKSDVRKICAIGVRVSRSVTMHGFALNVNTDLNYFNYIHPCGFVDKGVTSLQMELGSEQDIKQVQEILLLNLSSVFKFKLKD